MTTTPTSAMTAVPPTIDSGGVTRLGRHDVVDLVVTREPGEGNPFDADARVTLRGPDAAMISVPTFWDPPRGHVARISFPRDGSWWIEADRRGLLDADGAAFRFEVTAPTRNAEHGPLGVDPEYPRHFVHADGTRHFVRGYEVDWLLMIDQDDESLGRVQEFLDSIQGAGFTMVTTNVYARSFRRHVPVELERDSRWVVPSIAPWVGGNETPDYTQLDPAFFAHMDRVVAELHRRGVLTHLMIHVYNKDVNWPELGSADDDRFWRYVLARYQAFSTVMWDTAKESYHQGADYIWTRLGLIRRYDGYRRLLTAHDVNPPAGHDWGETGRRYTHPDKELLDALTDVISDQVLLGIYDDALERTTRFAKPYINIEFAYESGLDDLPSDAEDHDQDWREVTRRHWQVVMGGAYPNYYYRNTAWSLFVPQPEPPGYAAIRVLADFWDQVRYWEFTPAAHLVTAAVDDVYARSLDGVEYVVYSQSGAPFELEVSTCSGRARAVWLDPYTGATAPIGDLTAGRQPFTPPWGASAAVLHVTT
ncbi:DUF4038 domain-containing protein [Occultella aeris]|uniref:Endoglucanase n=1 Tax=Occultella aeris TaxID=2761496 RepID=A0A7M4DPK7_9MICO|nr:DUF4038 domain-containing protein [Occultella aeris]VZO39401.1 Putative endoglucanase [Occultella aeris]